MNPKFVFLEGEQRNGAIAFSREEWHKEKDPATFTRFIREIMASDWGKRRWRVPALVEGEKVAASMFLYDLSFVLKNQKLRVGGIGSFVVHKELRNKGLGATLLNYVHRLLKSEGYDIALLFSAISPSYYERHGYKVFPTLSFEAKMDDWQSAGPDGITASAIRSYRDEDFPAARNLYNTTMSRQPFFQLRDDDYWRYDFLGTRLWDEYFSAVRHKWHFLVGERAGRVVSYFRHFADKENRLSGVEYAFEPGAKEDITAMIRFLMKNSESQKITALSAVVPSRFQNLCPSRQMSWTEERKMMLCSLNDNLKIPEFSHPDEYFIWGADRF